MSRWHYVVWAVAVLYMAGSGVGDVIVTVKRHGWAMAVLYVVLYAVGSGCAYLTYRGKGSLWLVVACALGLGLHIYTTYTGTALLFLSVWLAPFRMRLWRALVLIVLVTSSFVAVSTALSVDNNAIVGMSFGLGWAGFLAVILSQFGMIRRQGAALAEAKVLAERQRLAREIHDILAHSLSAQVVHLEGARLLLEQGGDTALVLDRVTRAGDLARAGLEESKRAVAALRGDQTPLVDQLDRLAGQFRATTGLACEFTVSGDPAKLQAEAWLAIVRTAQEALTNAHKHAPGAPVMMNLRCVDEWCELEVRNTVENLGAQGNGYGLVGMRERAELIGGSLEAGPVDDGFRVRLKVPA